MGIGEGEGGGGVRESSEMLREKRHLGCSCFMPSLSVWPPQVKLEKKD